MQELKFIPLIKTKIDEQVEALLQNLSKINNFKTILIVFINIILIQGICFSQSENIDDSEENFRIMFYNVENHFDAKVDSSRSYNEFTPNGELHWTNSKYEKKRNNIYKVIKAVGGWIPVTMIGLVEIENEFVISDLINGTPLSRDGYKFVHYESKDFRGIDVALIYKSDDFTVLHSEKVVISDPQNPDFTTRDMLYVKGLLVADTIHVVVNHWTSRYRGYLESEPLRILAAQTLLRLTDSICSLNKNANILLMGDFNDNPENRSMQLIINSTDCRFDNLKMLNSNANVLGTLKYQGNWSRFDQILVANSLFVGTNGLQCEPYAHIFDAEYLLETDSKYLGLKTNRTNIGFKYHGGFSDHLPVFIDVKTTK